MDGGAPAFAGAGSAPIRRSVRGAKRGSFPGLRTGNVFKRPTMKNRNNNDKPKTALDTLREIAQEAPNEKISVSAFSRGLGRRGYGLLMVALNLPNLIPLPLPLLSIIFGLPLAVVAIQMALGFERPWIPAFLRERGIGKREMLYFCDQVDKRYGKFHKLIHPRLPVLTRKRGARLIGLAIAALATVMVLPIPFGNLVLAVPIAVLSLGLIERDGLFVLAGFFLGLCGLCFNLFVGSSILYSLFFAVRRLLGL